MINTKYVALSRQMALWKQMDVVSNNMANVNTNGYKAQEAIFSEYVLQTPQVQNSAKENVYFTHDFGEYKNFNEGPIVETGNALDVAIKGNGFFAVEDQNGAEKYTKKGQFTLNQDGALVTNEGNYVLSTTGEPIFFAPNEKDVSITETGEVFSTITEAGVSQNNYIANIKIVEFENPQLLKKEAGQLFANVENNKSFASDSRLLQGALEKSNVEGVVEMSKLIKLQRSYEYVQQMIDEEHTRLSNTIAAYGQMI